MESSPEGKIRMPPEGGGERKSKRVMKTPSQLESLEKTYAVEMYPSESLRAELSKNIGLSDRQLQMWFCHRRLKDRKLEAVKRSRKDMQMDSAETDEMMVDEPVNEVGLESDSGSDSSPFRQGVSHKIVAGAISRVGADIPTVKKCYEFPLSKSVRRAVASVEAQLGEPVREDGPILGMEFDSLPPDAFFEAVEMMGQQKESERLYDCEIYEQHDAVSIKAAAMDPDDCHFYPERPSVSYGTHERVAPSHLYDSPGDGWTPETASLCIGRPFLQENKRMTKGYDLHDQASSRFLSQEGRLDHEEYDTVPHKKSFTNVDPIVRLENPFVSSGRQVYHIEDAPLVGRKRKSEEARIAREIEAHEKRIRKELEKQDVLRRKREEQMQREMERHDRERRKEEERLMREKQREEEKLQREQRRELVRRERFLQKENLRAEKIKQKEELRREKEVARRKAAIERATARKIIKESMELIEDGRLELMELAASSKGLPSITSLDSDTLQNLELFRDSLGSFPPKSVQLKRPFAVQPWIDSEENVGNILMAWSFLLTFADVLELWPFTLDEFIQAFHDSDPRLLGEIHIALLGSIIKDIEHVSRTSSIGLGVNQSCVANPGGGHPHIVEGAYAWGFDLRSWKRHLNPLTWPEIFRQFALSAGFGPQLKKRSIEWTYFHDNNEDCVGEDIISTLRNGAAAENAVAIMRGKGFYHSRRSKNRLTPGTVKFAAFHILSLEGSKGLTILEVADKIQKSGLRDLTTSKTPEASIAAALSRDANLFERTAPSTYRVRPAFRKDPADAEAILSEARGKLQTFESSFSDYDEAEKDAKDAEDVERDEDSECDVADDTEIGVGTSASRNKKVCHSNEAKSPQVMTSPGNGKLETICNKVVETSQCGRQNAGKGLSFCSSGSAIDQSTDVAGTCYEASNPQQEDMTIDESNSGEPWVQGLMEGEYSDLSVEERLNALVALIGIAMEGNSVHAILEERLEAANALKKQMWVEAQLDKRRVKDEYVKKFQHSSFMGIKSEPNLVSSIAEGGQSACVVNNKNNEPVPSAVKQEELICHNVQSDLNNLHTERNLLGPEFSAGLDSSLLHHGYATEILRSQLKSYIGRKAEEMYAYRSLPLGQDRRCNRYWQFVTSASRNDPGSGRIFFESQDGCWRLIDSEEDFDALLASLDTRGIRESHLHSMLQKIAVSFKETVRRNFCCINVVEPSGVNVKTEDARIASSIDFKGIESPISTACVLDSDAVDHSLSFSLELGRTETEKIGVLKRYKDFQRWMWKECLNSLILRAIKYGKKRCSEILVPCDSCHDSYFSEENLCLVCHGTFETFHEDINSADHVIQCQEKQVGPGCNFHGSYSHLPPRVRLLKAQLASIELSVPPEALEPFWTEDYRKSWGMKLHTSSSADVLLQLLTSFEGAIKRVCLSSDFEMTKELLGSSALSGYAVHDSYCSLPVSVPVLPWVPQTTAAVALRLMELDASISYSPNQKVESLKDKEAGEFVKLPTRYTLVNTIQEGKPTEDLGQAVHLLEDNRYDPGNNHGSHVHRQGGCGQGYGHGGGCPGRVRGSCSESTKHNAGNIENKNQVPRQKSQTRGPECIPGCRTIRNSKRSRRRVFKDRLHHFGDTGIPKRNNCEELPRSLGEEWEDEEIRRMHVGRANCNSDDRLESDDNDQATEYKYDDLEADYANVFNGRSEDYIGESHEEGDGDEEDGDEGMYIYMKAEGNGDGGKGTSSSSAEYSD